MMTQNIIQVTFGMGVLHNALAEAHLLARSIDELIQKSDFSTDEKVIIQFEFNDQVVRVNQTSDLVGLITSFRQLGGGEGDLSTPVGP